MTHLEILQVEGHPKPTGLTFSYGTAGFRMESSCLDSVLFRTGLLAVLRSKCTGKAVGAMITASHNPEGDNGVKLVEPTGDMLVSHWEAYAIHLANADNVESAVEDIIRAECIDMSVHAQVIVGRDTRPSGMSLLGALKDGVSALGGKCIDYGFTTTPQLHYLVRCLNTLNTPRFYGEPSLDGYNDKLCKAFKKLVHSKPSSVLFVDAAHGIGAPALAKLASVMGDSLSVSIVNTDIESRGKLNHNCGADFVKLFQKAPEGLTLSHGSRACSLDGDADRIVFYYIDSLGDFKLLDGDKIATLAADFIMGLITTSKVLKKNGEALSVGVVQTAYANGSATNHVRDTLKVPVVFTSTGVKHLHHAAQEFDVGVYFEANGHGTVLFSNDALEAFHSAQGQGEAIESLIALTDLINQTVGDALSDLLLVEAILISLGMTFEEWDKAYTDLPSLQEKVKVADRSAFVTVNADTELVKPEGLQGKIDQEVAKVSKGRCFVRPSGTEDVVRVYAEAETVQEAESLNLTVCGLVFDYYGGVGQRPSKYL